MIWGAWKLWSQWPRAKIKAPACLADYRCNTLSSAGGPFQKKTRAKLNPLANFTSPDTTPSDYDYESDVTSVTRYDDRTFRKHMIPNFGGCKLVSSNHCMFSRRFTLLFNYL